MCAPLFQVGTSAAPCLTTSPGLPSNLLLLVLMMLIVLMPAIIAGISAISGFDQLSQKVLHPSRQRRQPVPEISSYRSTIPRIGENSLDPPKDPIPVIRLRRCIAQPM